MDAVICGRSDKQHGCDCSGEKAGKMDYLPRTTQMFEALGKDNGKLKSQEGLRTGQSHAAFDQDFFNALTEIGLTTVIFFLLVKI